MKKATLLSLILCFICALSLFASCVTTDGDSSSSAPNSTLEPTSSITIDKTELNLKQYEQTQLEVTLENLEGTVEWITSAPEVLAVENGLLTALAQGNATVTAKVGEYSAQCAVTVVANENVPALVLDKDKVEIILGKSLTVSAKVEFDGKEYESEYTYSILNPEIASVENGVVSGLALGETVLTATCNWRGVTLTESIPVVIKELIVLSWANYTGENIVLSTTDIFGDVINHTVTPLVVENDVEVSAPQVTYSVKDADGNESALVSVSAEGVITANGEEGIAYVTYNYRSTGGTNCTSVALIVECKAPVREIAPVDIEIGVDANNKQNANLALSGANFGADGSNVLAVTDITDGEIALEVENNSVKNVKTGTYNWRVKLSAGYWVKAEVTLVTLIISNAEELQKMTDILNASVIESETFVDGSFTYQHYHGYFILDADIDFGSKTFKSPIGIRDKNINNGFQGVFDGRNHVIKNLKIERGQGVDNKHLKTGLFGALGANGLVKNVKFTGLQLTNTWAATIGITTFGRIENVDIEITNFAAGASGISMYAYTLWRDPAGSAHHGGAQLENVDITLNISSPVTLAADGATFFCILGGDLSDCKGQFINNHFYANGMLNTTNNWNSNTSTNGSKLNDRFDAEGNSNYFVQKFAIATEQVVLNSFDSADAVKAQAFETVVLGNATVKTIPVTYKVTDETGAESNLVYVENGEVKLSAGATTGKAYVYAMLGEIALSNAMEVVVICEDTSAEKEPVKITPVDLELGVDASNKQNSALALTAESFSLTGAITAVTDITDGEKTLELTDGKVAVTTGSYKWIVRVESGDAVEVEVTVATLIISNAEELQKMTDILNGSVIDSETYVASSITYKKYYGYFILDADIDFGGKDFVAVEGIRAQNIDNGFQGVFDGRNHVIKNIKFTRVNGVNSTHLKTGLFGALGSNGIVKNVNFVGAKLTNTWASVIGISTFGRVENVNIEVTSYAAGASVISMYAYTLWKDSSATTHHGGAQLENVNVIVNVESAVTLSGDGGTYFCIVAGDVVDCKRQFINNYFVANGKITATNLWSSNTSSAGKAIKDRFDAEGNSNYFINEVSTASDAVVDANAKTLTLKIAGSESTSAVAIVNGKAVSASVEGGSVTLSGIELAESYNVTVYAGGKCYTVTVNA